ncbi:MAG: fused N-dimethylarginine dimethylaminohydrolase/saccharopine dehydrogenase domain-containing protein, partial [Gammaproteobacteria bacterium]|nr:fused N-dimethylarginine dimethylaminohydrolase/saccharopine dehydrogenase domain-containing protein [Gammaproteobacteria bacterium]
MKRERVLMCSPEHFRVHYAINPWMEGQLGAVDKALAHEQWSALRDQISETADVVTITPQDEWPDMVFTANAGMVLGNKAVVSRFYNDERAGEEQYFRQWFEREGYRILELPEELAFEGAGDALFQRDAKRLWAGYGYRTDRYAHKLLSDYFDVEVQSLHLVDPRFYHIDTCFCPLEGDYLLYHPQAFDEPSLQRINKVFPEGRQIKVGVRDAGQFVC